MVSQLPVAARKRAANFLLDNGNNLQRQRFAFHFEAANAGHVLDALQEYQNEDGGFGNGLEQDLRTRNSSVICTTVALQLMGEAGIASENPSLRKAMGSDWEEYGLTPIGLVDHPDSVFASSFSDSLAANFAYQINQQSDEGCWTPRWSWGGDYSATWAVVETEVKVELTLKFLPQLKRFNRLEDFYLT